MVTAKSFEGTVDKVQAKPTAGKSVGEQMYALIQGLAGALNPSIEQLGEEDEECSTPTSYPGK